MTKKDVVQQFRWDWSDFLKSNPNFRGDSIAKRCAFNDYVDGLNKDLSSLKRGAIDFKKLEAFLIKTGMKEGQRNSWLRDIKKLVVQ